MTTTAKDPVLEPGTWGEVHAHQQVVRYRHSGAGPGVVLLGAGTQPQADLWPELPGLLQSSFRIVLPQLPTSLSHVAGTLECLLDGVGASRIGLVAGGAFAYPALQLIVSGGESVGFLILVGDVGTETTQPADSAVILSLPVPVLVLNRALSPARAVALAVPFLKSQTRR